MAKSGEGIAENDSAEASNPDAYTPRYAIWCGLFVLWWYAYSYYEVHKDYRVAFWSVATILLPFLILCGTLLIRLTVNVVRRRWRMALSISAPAIALVVLEVVIAPINADLLRLQQSKPSYIAQVDALPRRNGPRLKCWDWGESEGLAINPAIFWTLVYDESDQIALPRSSWSAEMDSQGR
jgi:hypothetical protein